MSVNITVNGKYVSYRKHDLLNEPEYEKKKTENNRRKIRLIEARNASNNLSKIVREEIKKEKVLQLKRVAKIQVQDKEMSKNVLEKKQKDLSSVFLVNDFRRIVEEASSSQALKNNTQEKQYDATKKTNCNDKKNLQDVYVQTNVTDACYPDGTIVPKSETKLTKTQEKSSFSGKCSSSSFSILSFRSDESDFIEVSKFKNGSSVLENIQSGLQTSQSKRTDVPDKICNEGAFRMQVKKKDDMCEYNDFVIPTTSSTAFNKRFTQISDIIQGTDKKKSDVSDDLTIPILQQTPATRFTEFSQQPNSKSCKTVVLKSSSSNQTTQVGNTKVQFYDYNKKFQKEYDQPATTLRVHGQGVVELQADAAECAALNIINQDGRIADIIKLEEKLNERCQKAFEKEQAHRVCAKLTSNLNAISKHHQSLKSDNYRFSSAYREQINAGKQINLNTAFEDILKQPAILTCAVLKKKSDQIIPATKPISQTDKLNLGSPPMIQEVNSLNSVDSYCSMLLGYVNDQSKLLSEDIKKYNKQNGTTYSKKTQKLQDLLNRINRLRVDLLKELDKCTYKSTANTNFFHSMTDSLSELKIERENILYNCDLMDSILKRESDLKKKETLFEAQLEKNYKAQKSLKKEESENGSIEKKQNEVIPIEVPGVGERRPVSLKLNENKQRNKIKIKNEDFNRNSKMNHDGSNSKKLSKRLVDVARIRYKREQTYEGGYQKEEREQEFVNRHDVLVSSKPLEILIRIDDNSKIKKAKKRYFETSTKLSPFIKKYREKSVWSSDSGSTSYRSLPTIMHNNVGDVLECGINYKNQSNILESEQKSLRMGVKDDANKQSQPLNPLLTHYVQRLLCMSRTSINGLGITSSDIETPSSSVINTTGNIAVEHEDKYASNKLKSVQTFIRDNYTFVTDLEQSLKQSNSTDPSLKTIKTVFNNSFKENLIKQTSGKKPIDCEKQSRYIFKTTLGTQNANLNKEINLSADSSDLTRTCTQRIAALTEMIDKVRKEKQKILETTLSSASEVGCNSTEYLDLPNDSNKHELSSSISSTKNTLNQAEEIVTQFQKDKSIVLSRDSGISVRGIHINSSEDVHQNITRTEPLLDENRKSKPPLSIARYSTDFAEDLRHELSTIFEIETPATLEFNKSIKVNNAEDIDISQGDFVENIIHKKFPTFEEYARFSQLEVSQFNQEFRLQFEREFNEFIKFAREDNIGNYKQFTSFEKYFTKFDDVKEAARELLGSLKSTILSFNKFPERIEYLNKMGISTSDLLDSHYLEDVDERDTQAHQMSLSESLSKGWEPKLQNIIKKSFQQNMSLTFVQAGKEEQQKNILDGQLSTKSQSLHASNADSIDSEMKNEEIETQSLGSNRSYMKPEFTREKLVKQFKTKELSCEKIANLGFFFNRIKDFSQQLNLREFLSKELLKRTNTSSSIPCTDDSTASSIIRPIIGSMTYLTERQMKNPIDRQKTSTPMSTTSISSPGATNRSHGCMSSSGQLFSGESQISSVHFNSSFRDHIK